MFSEILLDSVSSFVDDVRRDENISIWNKDFSLWRQDRKAETKEGNEVNGWEAVGADLGYLYIMQPTLL